MEPLSYRHWILEVHITMFLQNFIEEKRALFRINALVRSTNIIKSSPRPISTSQLNPLLDLHTWPINLVIYKGSY